MSQYNKAQIKKIITVLEQQMAGASGKAFDKMERARRDLKNWDGTGPLPHEKTLQEMNVLGSIDSTATEEAPIEGKPIQTEIQPSRLEMQDAKVETTLDEIDVPGVIQTLVKMMAGSSAAKNKTLRIIATEIEAWRKKGSKGQIPYLAELQKLGVLSQANAKVVSPLEQPVVAKQEPKPVMAEKAVSLAEDEMRNIDQLEKEGHLYDAIQILMGEESEGAKNRLKKLQDKLAQKTRSLVNNARQIDDEQEKRFETRKTAWRAVLDINPSNQEAQEAFKKVQNDEIRNNIHQVAKDYQKDAEQGEREDNLPILNKALTGAQALLARVTNESSLADLQEEVSRTVTAIDKLRNAARERMGFMATAAGQRKYKEAYQTTRELIERSSPPPTILSADGKTEIKLDDFWRDIREGFITWLRDKASDYVADAREVAQSYPELARQKLEEALNILDADALTRDDKVALETDKGHVQDEIDKIDQQIKKYKQAGDLVHEAQKNAPPSERKSLLLQAKHIFPSYPDLDTLLADADIEHANELARLATTTIIDARPLADQDKYDQALEKIESAVSRITQTFPAPKKDTSLYDALNALDAEKQRILGRKNIYSNMLHLIPDVEKHIKDYDETKNESSLKAARALFDDLQRENPSHLLIRKLSSELIKRQGDPDNWNTGIKAYENQNWEAAEHAFKQITTNFANYAEVQKLLKRVNAAMSTIKGVGFEERKEWTQAIETYQVAVHIFYGSAEDNYPAYETDPITASYAEKSRSALVRLKDIHANDQQVDSILRECNDILDSVKRTLKTRSKLTMVDANPLFKKAETKLQKAIDMATTRADKLDELLSQIREVWLSTYIEGLQLVSEQSQKNKTLLLKANKLIIELEEAGLLSGYEALACKLQADALDMVYADMGDYRTGHNVDLEKMEENRRKRLSVQQGWPYEEAQRPQHEQKIRELERTLREIVDRRMKSDVEKRLNEALKEHGSGSEESRAAYTSVIEEMENDERLTGSVTATTGLIRIAWKAQDWQKAETFARRLRENTGADYVTISENWLTMCKAAQAFSENQVDDALAYISRLPKNDKDGKDLRDARAELEKETLERLLEEAKKSIALDTDAAYMDSAQKYALAFKLSPKNPMVASGLKKIGTRVEKTIISLCTTAESLQLRGVTMGDLNSVCGEARTQYTVLSNLANISSYLNLKPSQVDALNDAAHALETKSRIWDAVKSLLDNFEKDMGVALNQPDKIDSRRNTGGWNLESFERYLQEARKTAGRDVQLGRLIEDKLTDWNAKKDMADHLNRSVMNLMNAVAAEEFDQVISLSTQLDEDWKRAQREHGFEGLKILVYETYPNALGRAETPLQHRDIALRQKQDLTDWSKWAVNVKDKYSTLSKIQRELQFRLESWRGLGDDAHSAYLNERLSIENGIGMSLKDILERCIAGQNAVSVFVSHFEAKPAGKPISKSSQSVAASVELGWAETLPEFQKYLSDLSARASQNTVELEKLLKQLENSVKNLQTLASKSRDGSVTRAAFDTVRVQLEKCKNLDPYSREVNRIEQTLNGFSPR